MDVNSKEYLTSDAIFSKFSDMTRIVDPLQNRVIRYNNVKTDVDDVRCFDYWGKNEVCDNCISMRAYNDNTSYIKMEYNKDKMYLVTAVPYDLPDRRVVIEILKDITNSVFLDSADSLGIKPTNIHAFIDNMKKLTFSDPLTGVYNRRYIIEKLPVDLLNVRLLSKDLSVIMVDIDHFKAVNDTYGHLAGDQALKKVAETVSGCIRRSSDWIARYGGEEFVICMPGAGLEIAKTMAELMRKSVEQSSILYDGMEFCVTASFGVQNIKSTESDSVDDLLKHVDEKLYLAKENGRNRVEA